jgi:hypothetical protein
VTVFGAHPQRLDLYVHPGDPIDFTVPVLNALDAAQDLSGWAVAATATDPGGTVLHDFSTAVSGTSIRVTAGTAETRAWQWTAYAARLVVTGTPPTTAAIELATGWIRLYRP